jgi:TetR/AcrR family transcriptional regulator, cholesterol catabolism regulator
VTVEHPRQGSQADILKTFTALVAARGYDATSLSDVASALGLSKGTITYHFGSKDQLLKKMSLDYMDRRIAELELISEAFECPVQRLASIIGVIITAYRDDGPATRAFSREFMRFLDDPVMAEARVSRERYTATVRNVVQEGISSGHFRCTNSRIVTLQIFGMCNWGWTWLDPDGELSVQAIADIYVDTLLNGICTGDIGGIRAEVPESVRRLRDTASPSTA